MKLPKIVEILAFNESRKVGFGMWLFIVACVFLVKGFIDSDKWMICAGCASALVGGGTVADAWLKRGGGKNDLPSGGS
jgi:hypothetical protein